MTEMVFAIIDNHNKKKGHGYKFIFKTKSLKKFEEYIEEKGLI